MKKDKKSKEQDISYTDIFKNPKDISVELLWKLYSDIAFKGMDASEVQYIETKKAYMAGFTESFKIMVDLTEHLSEKESCEVLDNIALESNKIVRQMIDEHKKGTQKNDPNINMN